jgi:hypothetical protein
MILDFANLSIFKCLYDAAPLQGSPGRSVCRRSGSCDRRLEADSLPSLVLHGGKEATRRQRNNSVVRRPEAPLVMQLYPEINRS